MSHDNQLQQAVIAELGWDSSLSADHIGVMANAGVVTLSGHVESFAEKHAAERAALRVKGVNAVAEEIEVRLPFERQRSDDEIAAAVIDRIAWDVSIPSGMVKVKVEQGFVTLSGQANSYHQKDAAGREVRPLFGVTGLSNEIMISPAVDVKSLSDEITHALNRSWFFDPKTITVNTQGGNVHLTGTVHTQHERQLAAATAWSAPGTITLRNDIAIL